MLFRSVNNQVVDANNNLVTDWLVVNGVAYDTNGNAITLQTANSGAVTTATQQLVKDATRVEVRAQDKSSQLPQTGEAKGIALTALGLLTASMATLFGFKKREN